jgi:OOP family OmpA-OmpF porin
MRVVFSFLAVAALLAGCATGPAQAPERYIVFFNFDSAELSADSRAVVREASEHARRTPAAPVELAGYTGREPDARTDDQLALQRFTAVENAMAADGVDRARLRRVALMDETPLPATAVRRIEIRFPEQAQR